MRAKKLVMNGEIVYSFGKNGTGLTDEFITIGEFIKVISKDNHVYLSDAILDPIDDVYDFKFTITPHTENNWVFDETNKEKTAWYSTATSKAFSSDVLNMENSNTEDTYDPAG